MLATQKRLVAALRHSRRRRVKLPCRITDDSHALPPRGSLRGRVWRALWAMLVLASGLTTAAAQGTTAAPGGGASINPNIHVCPPDCPPTDVDPPIIFFSLGSAHPIYQRSVAISIGYRDHQVNNLGRKETFNGVNVVPLEDSITGRPDGADITGVSQVVWMVYFHLTLLPGQNLLYAYICDYVPAPQQPNCGSSTDTLTFIPDSVAALQKSARAFPLETKIASFTVRNTGGSTYSYNLVPTCTGAATACQLVNVTSPISIAAGASVQVDVRYTASSSPQSGTVVLAAKYAPLPTLASADTVTISTRPYAALYTSDSLGVGSIVERDQCLMFSLGSSAAYECGDLRLVHPLPSLRTLGKERAPTLIYNSQHAHPFPIIPSRIALPTGALPDTVYGLLKVDGTFTGDTAKWPGADWVPGSSRRVSVAFDGLTKTSGIHAYQLEVRKGSTTRTLVQIDSGTVAIVNRAASPFGAGWWLAGMESLDPSTKTWIGGDGSVRQFRSAGTNVWVAPNVDHPDTLRFDGTYYTRYLPHGARVKFNTVGQHVYTIDRLGYQTVFAYATGTSSQLTSLQLPSPLGTLFPLYTFSYASGRLQSVNAPLNRITTITDSAGLITRITDPDTATVRFGYSSATAANRIVARTDPLNHTATYAYDAGGKVVEDSLYMGSGTPAIVAHYRPAESRGLWRSADQHAVVPESVFTRVDGPRPEADITNFWLDTFGGPVRISDALGEETLIYNDAQWPALAAKLRYDNNRVLTSSYDVRGNVTSTVDSSTFQDSVGVRRYSTTRYHWKSPWDYPDSIVTAAAVTTTFDYDAVGNRTWQQIGPDSTRRVWFYYYPGLPTGVGLLRATKAPLVARDSLLYSIYGNVSRARSPKGYWETRVHEASGHDTSDVVAITAGDTSSSTTTTGRLVTRITHDIMGRVTATDVTGPQTSYATASRSGTIPQQILRVRNFYNKAGLTDSVQRWAFPDTNHIGISTTRWARDNADRVVTETTPDGASTYDIYDPAGNVMRHQGRRATLVYNSYDLLNRLTRRQSPNVFYADTTIPVYRFPRYRLGSSGYLIPGDTATFTYDNVGNMLTANNGAAHISRSYNANGTLAVDTMRTRTWDGAPGDFNQHVYVNTYTYDLAGRRTSLTFPVVVGGTQQYTYDGITGNLGSVIDVLGNRFAYSYDAAGRMDSLEYPGKIFERSYFNAVGELWRRREVAYNAFIGTDSGFASNGAIHDDTLTYDARGKIITANVILQRIVNSYSGLGAMTSSYMRDSTAPAGVYITEEAYEQDALGNNYFSFDRFPGTLLSIPAPEYKKFFYQPASGRQVKTMAGTQASQIIAMADTSLYDPSGNTEYYARVTPVLATSATSTFQRSYYDGLDKLAVAEKFSSDSTSPDGGFEEYRYDALGRRVLRRWRGYWACANPCYNAIERTVWDGNQILVELRHDGSDLLSPAELYVVDNFIVLGFWFIASRLIVH